VGWDLQQVWWVAGAAALCAVALAVIAGVLRQRLRSAERQLLEFSNKLETTTIELKRLSGIDALTGVANRRFFDEMLDKEWARAARSRQPLAIIMVDIDRFKIHNDTYGHQAGDECLRQVASVLKHSVRRPADLVARYGGEEFSVILPGADVNGATAVAERMRAEVQAIKLAHAKTVTGHDVTVSLGVAVVVPDQHHSALELVAAADEALYRAKAVGRNQVIVADALEVASETIDL